LFSHLLDKKKRSKGRKTLTNDKVHPEEHLSSRGTNGDEENEDENIFDRIDLKTKGT
jgi:hypothetical protein